MYDEKHPYRKRLAAHRPLALNIGLGNQHELAIDSKRGLGHHGAHDGRCNACAVVVGGECRLQTG
jgi:hypothetical protein